MVLVGVAAAELPSQRIGVVAARKDSIMAVVAIAIAIVAVNCVREVCGRLDSAEA